MYLPQNEVYLKSFDHLKEVWRTGNWHLNSIQDNHVIVSNLRCDTRSGFPFWFRCSHEWFLRLDETCRVSGLVFHVSRCGSTLLRNLLDVPDNQICLNEPLLFNKAVINRNSDLPKYMARLTGSQTNIIVKTTSWNVLLKDWLVDLFPVPTVFVYRHPFDVLASLSVKPNAWIDDKDILALFRFHEEDRLIRYARCIDQFFERTDFDIAIPYERVVDEAFDGLPQLFGYTTKEEMKRVATLNSKGQEQFVDDREVKTRLWNDIASKIPEELTRKLLEKQNGISHIR